MAWILVFLLVFTLGQAERATEEWNMYDGKYFKEVKSLEDQSSAKSFCQIEGARLAMPKSPDINEFITGLLNPPESGLSWYWIGLDVPQNKTSYYWQDGTPADSRSDLWLPGEPYNEDNGRCAAIIRSNDVRLNGRWTTRQCAGPNSGLYYICEKAFDQPSFANSPKTQLIESTWIQIVWSSWSKFVDRGDGPITGYLVQLGVADGSETVGYVHEDNPLNGVTTYRLTIHRLSPNTSYDVTVTPIHRDAGPGSRGPALTVRTSDASPGGRGGMVTARTSDDGPGGRGGMVTARTSDDDIPSESPSCKESPSPSGCPAWPRPLWIETLTFVIPCVLHDLFK